MTIIKNANYGDDEMESLRKIVTRNYSRPLPVMI